MLSSPTSTSSVFSYLPARPPTPPRDISKDVDDALRFLEEGHQESDQLSASSRVRTSTDTPPPLSPASSQQRGSTATKKVDFSPWPTYHKIPQLGHFSSPGSRALKQTPLAREAKPLKSILKPANERLPPTPDDLDTKLSYFSPFEPGSFRKMLQSVLNQLASQSRDARRDAYLAMNGALKSYEGMPDVPSMVEKISLLQQFLTRDMAWKNASGVIDSNIVTQAVQLTCSIIFNPRISPALDDDFRSFVIDRSTAVLEDKEIPKSIAKAHLFLLSHQRLSSGIMTTARAEKLLTALQTIEDRVTGNSTISARLVIYQRLIEQSPGMMLNHMRDWIGNVFHGLLSSITDTRLRAIETCSRAALRYGDQPQAAKVIYDIIEQEGDDGTPYGDYINLRLMQMTADKEVAALVPQIWAAIIMFLRCKRRPVEKWPKMKPWLITLQKCLNSGDLVVKQQANIAWNKLTFVVMPDASTTLHIQPLLRLPIVAGLERRGNDKTSQQLRQIAMDSYCNLLHYTLRPALSYEELDFAWDVNVDEVLMKMSKLGNRSQYNACRILHGLLQKSNGIWNANAANEPDPIKPEELPQVAPRWLRSRLGKVLKVLEPMVFASMWSSDSLKKAVDGTWRLLMQAVAEAGSQEVKTSNELKDAIAQLTNFFRRLWLANTQPRAEEDGSVWLNRYHSLLEVAVESLGGGHFIEDILAKTTADEVEAAPTPSRRSSKHPATAYPPLVFLFALHYQPTPALRTDNLYKESAGRLLRLITGAKSSTSSVIALLHRSLQFCTAPRKDSEADEVAGQLWCVVVDVATDALKTQTPATPQRDAQIMGVALHSARNVLTYGLRYAKKYPDCLTKAFKICSVTCESARHYGGDGGVVLGVMEPLAKSIVDMLNDVPNNVVLQVGITLLENGAWPKTRHELEHARKALWTISAELRRTPVFEPFEHVYTLLVRLMDRAYDQMADASDASSKSTTDFFGSLLAFLTRCPTTMLSNSLRRVQGGVVTWIEDRKRLVFQLPKANMSSARERRPANLLTIAPSQVVELWSNMLQLIDSIPRKDSQLLQSLEPLMIAGLSSPSRDIVNKTIVFWNQNFGNETTLEYPSRILPVLRARQTQTEVLLPNFPEDISDSEAPSLPVFAETQPAESVLKTGSDITFRSSPRVTSEIRRRPPIDNFLIKQHLAAQGLPYDSFRKDGTSSSGSTPARLRHDDSQVDFAPIDPSPPSITEEESQNLTENQKEVRARQQGDAQMFPELSSSPHASAATKNIAKKLNFISDLKRENNGEIVVATPTGLADGNPMSDDLPSSPTPRANAAARTASQLAQEDDEDAEETDIEMPSSPPREDDVAAQNAQAKVYDDTTVDIDATITQAEDQEPSDVHKAQTRDPENGISKAAIEGNEQHVAGTSDLPSDTQLPTVQLEHEAAATEAEEESVQDPTPLPSQEHNAQHQGEESQVQTTQQTPQMPSKIADSMLELGAVHPDSPAESNTPSTRGSKRCKKRKRSSKALFSPKKKPSPFKEFFTTLVGQPQEEQDIGEEIIVAGSQVAATSYSQYDFQEEPSQLSVPAEAKSQEEDDVEPEEEKPAAPKAHSKRGRGRPKKSGPQTNDIIEPEMEEPATSEVPAKCKQGRPPMSNSPSSSQAEAPMTSEALARGRAKKTGSYQSSQAGTHSVAGLKRRASTLSIACQDDPLSASIVEGTPAPTKPRNKKAARLSQGATDAGSSSRRVASSPVEREASRWTDAEAQDDEDELASPSHELGSPSPEQQLANEQSAARKIAQPKSILSRLRGVLSDCKKMVFGSQEEERAFDDVLFEIRREVHEASRRGREA